MRLNKAADSLNDQATELTIAEAEAIATDRPDLIWLEVAKDDLYSRRNMTPNR
jgi:hypothetical protein